MAFFTLDRFSLKMVRSPGVDPVVNPQPVEKGTIIVSSDSKSMALVLVGGHLGGDNFEVQFTAGSNLVVIPNNVMNWSGLKLFSPQFPAGVAITSKTANYREYTIETAATVTRKEFANFNYNRSVSLEEFGNYNLRPEPSSDMNTARNEGSYYFPTATSNLPVAGSGYFLDVKQRGSSIIQDAIANTLDMKQYTRRSTDAGLTWTAWTEVLVGHPYTWVAGTLQNGFTTYNSLPIMFAKQGNLAWIKGAVVPPGTYGDSYTMVTIPTGFTPVETQYGAAMGIGTGSSSLPTNRLRVSSTGILTLAHNLAVGAWDCSFVYRLK